METESKKKTRKSFLNIPLTNEHLLYNYVVRKSVVNRFATNGLNRPYFVFII